MNSRLTQFQNNFQNQLNAIGNRFTKANSLFAIPTRTVTLNLRAATSRLSSSLQSALGTESNAIQTAVAQLNTDLTATVNASSSTSVAAGTGGTGTSVSIMTGSVGTTVGLAAGSITTTTTATGPISTIVSAGTVVPSTPPFAQIATAPPTSARDQPGSRVFPGLHVVQRRAPADRHHAANGFRLVHDPATGQ